VIEDDDSSDEEMQVESEAKEEIKEKETVEEPEPVSVPDAKVSVSSIPVKEPKEPKESKAQSKLTKKKDEDPVDDDDDDDDHEEEDDAEEEDDDDDDDEEEEKPAKTPKGTKKPAKTLKGPKTQAQIKSDKADHKSDQDILKAIDSIWDTALPYSVLCKAFGEIEAVTSRLAIQEILTTLFRQVMLKSSSTPTSTSTSGKVNAVNDMYPAMYLASNSVAPAYDCVELGIGDAILIKAIGEACGSSPAMVKQRYEKEGDLGNVTMNFKSKLRTLGGFFTSTKTTPKKVLTCSEVLTVFREIAKTKGNQSQKWKVEMIKKLLVRATDAVETKYIIRGLQGKLRIGLAESTVLISLAHALALTPPKTIVSSENDGDDDENAVVPAEAMKYADTKSSTVERLEAAVGIIKKAYSEVPSYDAILDAALKVPLHDLHKACTLSPGIPVAPMLAKPTKSIQEVLKRLDGLRFTVEYKYDGERAQVHLLPDGTTRVFSRSLLDTSEKYPEVPLFVKEACKDVQSFVLDAEVVAFNNKTGQLVPFQILSTRKKTEESAETAKVQVIVQAFDLMYLNGKSLLNNTLAERRKLMHKHFEAVEGKFQFAKSLDHEENGDTIVIEEFLDAAVKGQCEGLMVKTLDVNAIYEPSRRSLNWLKLKKDYLEGLGDSVDLVPIGGYHGRGKRTGVFGAYLLACYDTDTEQFQSVCKVGTGFSEEALKTLGDSLKKHVIPTKTSQYSVSDQLECDVWFDAVQVWEVKAADLSKSSAHRGAEGKTGEAGRGIGLRFPRFERLREDKRPEAATSSDQILEMYYQQDAIVAAGGDDDEGMDDEGI
jgi:DNA ligase-1